MSTPTAFLRLVGALQISTSLIFAFSLGCTPPAKATEPNVLGANIVSLDTLHLNGNATLSSIRQLFLTDGLNGQVGSAFIATPTPFGPSATLEVAFAYQASGSTTAQPADGLALILESATPDYLGLSGSGMGFFNEVPLPGIGVTVDYFQNSISGSPANTIAVATAAGVDLAQAIPSLPLYGGSGSAGVRFVWVVYNNATNKMQVFYSGIGSRPPTPTLELTLPQDLSSLLGGQLYVGLSASTGTSDCVQAIFAFAVKITN